MRFKRSILISVEKAQEAMGDKLREEALGFAIQIKHTFESSTLKEKNTKKKYLKKTFKIGEAKLSRVLKNAVRFGYVRRENGLIIANRLYNDREEVGSIHVSKNLLVNKEAVKHIKRIVIMSHFKKQNYHFDLLKKRQESTIRKNRRKKNQMVQNDNLFFGGTSYKGIARKINCSERNAIRFIDELVAEGYIRKNKHYTTLKGRQKEFSKRDKAILAEQEVHLVFVWEIGELCIQNPNLYFLTNRKDVKYINLIRNVNSEFPLGSN